MKNLEELLSEDKIKKIAPFSHFKKGRQMLEKAEVIFDKQEPYHIVARVKPYGGGNRTVDLNATENGVEWHCTCTSNIELFCNHCVAVALKLTHTE